MNLKKIITSKIYTSDLSSLPLEEKCIICTINPHSYCESKKDEVFAQALLSCDVLLPDGSGIVMAAKVLEAKVIKKIAGADIHDYLLEQANIKGQKVFYLGASDETLKLIDNNIKKQFVNIEVGYFSPPYKSVFSKDDTLEMLEKINSFKPDVLFVGMTAPKQEKWVYLNQSEIRVKTLVSIGAVFDFYAGNIKRSNPFWIKIGLEWLPRLIKEPKRLFYRNFVSTPKFIFEIISFKLLGRGFL